MESHSLNGESKQSVMTMLGLNLKRRHDRGYSLIELLIVLTIIGLLAALVGPTLYAHLKPAKRSAAQAQIENFSTALDSFFIDTSRYPTTEEGLQALREDPGVEGWKGPYLKKQIPLDPWGNAFVYRSPGRSGGFEILSLGADNNEGGEEDDADIVSWDN